VNVSEVWIRRPVMTTMVTAGVLLFGVLAYRRLPINNLPDVEFPTISVRAVLPGASPETMAATVATPLEKKFSSIAGIESMTSTSTLGVTTINLQFALKRRIDDAALDVNAAIASAMGVLPRTMPNPPTYNKVNPNDMPVVFIGLTSDTMPITAMHDQAENVLIPYLSTVPGVAEVDVVPPQKYAVRVQLNPDTLASRGIGLNEVTEALQSGNVNYPGGTLDSPASSYTIDSNGQLPSAKEFNALIVAFRNGAPVRIGDLGEAIDGIENDRASSRHITADGAKPMVIVRVRKQIGENTVEVARQVKQRIPRLRAAVPAAIDLEIFYDQSEFIEESVLDVQYTLALTIFLVIVVVFLFIRAVRPTLIPSLVVPLSLIAVFPLMSVLGYTLNTLSLMALTLSIGFVVDDAIVVTENIIRRMESGQGPLEASLRGSREIGFTVLSMTVSLAIVFVPIMFMSGILGRLFREFAVAITAAILISGVLSLTLTPMLASRWLRGLGDEASHGRLWKLSERVFDRMLASYRSSLALALRHRAAVLAFTVVVSVASVLLYRSLPKGFIPNQDQGFFRIFSQVEDKTSFTDMLRHQEALDRVVISDPDCGKAFVGSIVGFTSENSGLMFVALASPKERKATVDEIITRLRPRLNQIPGLFVSLVNPPVITIGSRLAAAQWQLTLQGTDLDDLYRAGALLEEKLRTLPALTDVKSDLQLRKPKLAFEIDRDRASALGLTLLRVQDCLYSAYAARQVSTIYTASNFYYVILELQPNFREKPSDPSHLYLKSTSGELVPLTSIARVHETVAPLAVNHSGQIPAATIQFNLAPGKSIGAAMAEVTRYTREALPATVSTSFQGTAQAFASSIASMGFLLIITVVLVYLVLGVLYESFIHPLTILTALPLAGFGALAALALFRMELNLYAWVGIIMLVGIVKKNGIMMVDFALSLQRAQGLDSEQSVFEACMTRFRPIMMTTMAALIGMLPIALGLGAGGEARAPLGVAVVGGLLFSQILTLYVTPVFYVYLDRLNRRFVRTGGAATPGQSSAAAAAGEGVQP
jgi:hydrophobic/amphiphilic exporter-1 (mainly G- bacteria), HAE1 family